MISTSLREDLVRNVQPIDLRIADLGQVKLAYVEAGSGEPVVFVHGIPTDYRAWNSQIVPFSAAKFQRNSLDPSLKAFRQGDFDAALGYNLDDIMNRHGAFEKFPEPVRTMVKENERTVGELMAEVPVFGREEASKISAPTLLIHGTESPAVLHVIVDRLGKAIPKSEVSMISGAAHFPHFEKPQEFNQLVLGFLSKHSSH